MIKLFAKKSQYKHIKFNLSGRERFLTPQAHRFLCYFRFPVGELFIRFVRLTVILTPQFLPADVFGVWSILLTVWKVCCLRSLAIPVEFLLIQAMK